MYGISIIHGVCEPSIIYFWKWEFRNEHLLKFSKLLLGEVNKIIISSGVRKPIETFAKNVAEKCNRKACYALGDFYCGDLSPEICENFCRRDHLPHIADLLLFEATRLSLKRELLQWTLDIRDHSGPGQLVPYIRMSLITDRNYVHFGQTDRKNRPS